MIFLIKFFPKFISKILLNYFIFWIFHLVRTQNFRKKLTFPTSWYAHGSKKCWFFGNFCVHIKWTFPSIISFLVQFVYLDLAKFRTTFLKPLPILHLFPCFHRFSSFWYHLPRVSRVGVGGSIAGVKTWKGVRYSKMFRRRIIYLDAWWPVTPE